MIKLDHLTLPVTDMTQSRSWYVGTLGFTVEFEVPDRHAVAIQDSEGFTIFLQQASGAVAPNGLALYFQVANVDATFQAWSERAVTFAHPPEKTYWGYGAELEDPDGYRIRLWDEQTMKAK